MTRFEWLAGLKGRSLLKAVPFSGRTNQIRVHLASRGLPVVNDPVYGRESEGPCFSGLHSLRLGFNGIEGWQEIRAPWPEHFQPFCEAAGLASRRQRRRIHECR
ncbi:MAG: hypothetical protein GWM98_18445 [Nitrospinaceae bacterium]|nr:RNA pseudouridine synthase [Nitrospinaceae bacterium]NIR56110.1 RNA pseudouridine synthase [Nitrospinaceae bacterium]NIS86558.1 RNA pseudouridine synthase [Nitrospinaceae bacterium]NIT83392.1 RNA pseudouridine synthase [Nitrospinaceae bacterium]NIU45602.1 RNA pseudouridine synthase [Nitrospinaceae bacterium]